MALTRTVLSWLLGASFCAANAEAALRPPVHPRRNVEDFPAVPAKYIRFTILKASSAQPCVDELEIFPEDEATRNLALASASARATASGSLPGYQIHQLEFVNDGRYGNGHSWIADKASAWVQIELPQVRSINRVVWGRDRESNFVDRLATEYRIEVSTDGSTWRTVASSADRSPLVIGDTFAGVQPMTRQIVTRFAPVNSGLSFEAQNDSPDYRIDRWQTEDGLPGNTVTSILQTRDGYLWIGTFGGLARFDGVQFKRFGEAEGLRNNRVLSLCEDRQGNLWVATEGGGLFRLRDGAFTALTTRDGLRHDVVTAVAEDGLGQLWIGTYAGLQCWQKGHFIQAAAEPFRFSLPVTRLLVDRGGTIWMVVNGQLRKVEGNRLLTPELVGEPSGQLAISALHEGGSGQLWLGGNSGYVASSSNSVLRVLRLPDEAPPDNIWEVWEARNGDVWMGTASSGLRRWRNGRLLTLTTQEGLAENSVRCLFEDREGNLWVGTNGGGLQRLKPKTLRLVTTRDGLAHNVVMSLAEDATGDLWIGSNCGGLSARRHGEFAPAYLNYLLDNECIWSVLSARDESLWVGTWSSGLFRKRGEKLEQFKLANSPRDEPVLALCEERAGGLWVGTYQDGLKFFRDGKFTSYRTTNGLSANFITALVQDASSRLWIGTAGGGLNRFADGVFKVFTRQDGLGSDFIRALYIDGSGVLWVGTGGGGLSRIKDGQLATIGTRKGLLDDVISQILEDDRGHLWFGSNRGIFYASKAELHRVADGGSAGFNPITYGKSEGMENLECTGGYCPAGLKTRDGKLWFSTVKGLVMIDPKNTAAKELPPPVVIEQVVVDGAPAVDPKLLTSPIHNSKLDLRNSLGVFASSARGLRIGPRARRVELHYTALNFTAPEKVRFRYRLDGLDADWVEAKGRRVAEYPFLPPGPYHFRVTACNEDGVWSESEAGLSLTCLPAFWQTWWFRLLVVAMVLGGAGWAVKIWATRRLQRRLTLLQQEHALEQERMRIARDIHDELGASLTEISLLSDHGQKRLDRPGEVENDLQRISTTAREAVQTADGIVWAVNPRNDSLDHLANYLVHFAEDFFRLTKIRCRLDVPANLLQITLPMQHRHHLLLAVKEACNNVARHSEASEMWLRMNLTDQEFSIIVEDNGKGFRAESTPESSNGLRNLRERMAELGGRLELSSQPGRGTRVKLIAPLNQLNQFTCPSA